MLRKNLYIISVILLFGSCASYEPQYRYPELKPVFPSEKKIEKTFYLVGDAGYSPIGGMSDALTAFQKLLKNRKTKGDYAIFLGDNIYPAGMPVENDPERPYAENHIKGQLSSVENFEGEVIFIPGNHDWYNDGLNGLAREESYLLKLSEKGLLRPSGGCPLESIEVSENIQLIVVDTQWYLENWDTDPNFNDRCEIKTREKFFIEVEIELQKHQNKTIVFAMHHPMFSYGTHGGHYSLEKHLYPTQQKIPLPGLASLVAQIRSQGGVSVQDRYNELYNKLMNRLAAITKKNKRLVFASGHEHCMHHIEADGMIQIQTGNGAKSSFGSLGEFGEFSYGGQGFAVMDVFEDGSSWVSYYGVDDQLEPLLLFQKEMIPPTVNFNLGEISERAIDRDKIKTAIYKRDTINEALFFKTIWGQKYKEVYAKEVEVSTGSLDSIFGGLIVLGESSNDNYKALKLQDKKGNQYRMRALKKNALNFISKKAITPNLPESTDSREKEINEEIPNTSNFDANFYTAGHPFALMAIPALTDAIDIFSVEPKLFYIPKQRRLGDYNENFGDELYYISIQPNEASDGQRAFKYPNDIETTDDILIKLRKRADIAIDEKNYIKSRLFDMLTGDWDRESDHWRWAEYFNRDSLNVYVPIPKNRDDAFSSLEGPLLGSAKSIFGSNNQKHIYEPQLSDLDYFNKEGIVLDRALLQKSGRAQWTSLAREIQLKLTDSLIDAAFAKIPSEVQEETLAEIIETLKKRRENLVDIADRYYSYLSTQQTITGSNYNDFFEITRMPSGETNVKVYANYKNDKAEPLTDRTFKKDDTNEIWIYGLDGGDTFEVKGDDHDQIFVRLIGGQGIDTYRLIDGRNTKVYDHQSIESNIEEHQAGRIRLTDVYNLNVYDFRKQINSLNKYVAAVGYNPDDGITTDAAFTYQLNSFQRNPFSQQHVIDASYYFETSSFDLEYSGEFANIQNDKNLSFGAYFSSPNYRMNYFGYGNETINSEETLGLEHNRVEVQTISANLGLLRNSAFGSFFKLQLDFEAVSVNSPLAAANLPNSSWEMNKTSYFGTLEGIYSYRSFDNALNPTKGMMFDLNAGIKENLQSTSRLFGFLNTRLGFYNALTADKSLVLKTNIRAAFNFDNKFEFYHGVHLGANTGLRGFREERFTGKSTLVGSADIRYSFKEFKIELVPVQMGLYLGGDLGKLWVPSQNSDIWHNSLGGGLWIYSLGALNGSLSAFNSVEGTRFQFAVGLSF
jgi:hypothetical protein